MKHRHVFTPIAPDAVGDDTVGDDSAPIWKWCIRCGTLKLGRVLFAPGKTQKLVIRATA